MFKELKFKSDTKHRKQWFTGLHFSHPAKMHLSLQMWLIENFTKEGETILDPMAGSGTILVACSMGRNVVAVELEQKFVDMQRGNWEKIRERGPMLGYHMGQAEIIQGDARQLDGLLVDRCIFSPPYAETLQGSGADAARDRIAKGKYKGLRPDVWTSKTNIAGSTFGDGYSRDPSNISNLPYGTIDKIITSPPYETSDVSQTHMTSNDRGNPNNPNYRPSWKRKLAEGYADTKRPYVDAVISSPPYEGTTGEGKEIGSKGHAVGAFYYGNGANIGNLKGDTYLQAMYEVYTQCFNVLKPDGLMVLVTKNFIRNKKEIRLDEDTINICEKAGFTFTDRHYRKLTAQSFWRTIYQQKYPDAPVINKEDILIFRRAE